jgi:hypothetical protein
VKIVDEAVWQERRAALLADKTGRDFLVFLEDWADRAEKNLESFSEPNRAPWAADALREQLMFVEERRGRCAAHYLGQMLAVLAEHWEYGAAMMEELSSIERRVVEDLTLLKIADEQDKAAQVEH